MPSTPLTCLLDRLGHGLDQRLGAGARIGGRHLDRRWGDIRDIPQTGSANSETPPITIVRMAITLARIGRSMKNFEIIAPAYLASFGRKVGGHLLHLRLNLLSRRGLQQAGDDDLILRRQPRKDAAHAVESLADRHLALLDDIVGVDDEDIAAALIGADRFFRHQHGIDRPQRHMHAHVIAGQKPELFVVEHAAHIQCAGRGIDVGRDIIDHAFVGEVAIGLQRDLDRHFADDIGGGDAVLGHRGADSSARRVR